MLELLDAEEKILVDLTVWNPGTSQALLHGGVDQAPGSLRALARLPQNVRNDNTAFLALNPALFDQVVYDFLDPLAGDGGSTYL
jgi:hypothetical protein